MKQAAARPGRDVHTNTGFKCSITSRLDVESCRTGLLSFGGQDNIIFDYRALCIRGG